MIQEEHLIRRAVAFDEAAESYDTNFTYSPIGILQRSRVHNFLWKALPHSSIDILELNCGTGEDAIWLALKGHHVVATDASEKMIGVCNRKIAQCHLDDLVTTRQFALQDIRDNLAPESFDLVFSNFGGLNCLSQEELIELSQNLSTLIRPDGKFIAVVMGRKCLWEIFHFMMRGRFSSAFRRNTNKQVEVRVGKFFQSTWYYSPARLSEIFSENFEIKVIKPIGISLPPSYKNRSFENRHSLLSLLDNLESKLSFSSLSNYADHFYIEMVRR